MIALWKRIYNREVARGISESELDQKLYCKKINLLDEHFCLGA